jgi:leader peptidase (prepilin peptidase)/N-methyltransferase
MVRLVLTGFAALLGLAFGSFLNVCLTRWPEGESVVKPRSHCRTCNRTLAWWENVPLVSWLALRGRCRSCKTAIGWRYPLVELAVGVLWAIVAWRFFSWALVPGIPELATARDIAAFAGRIILFWLLVALAVLDAENLWLPNWLTLPGIALGFLYSVLLIPISYDGTIALARFGGSDSARAAIASLLEILIAAGIILLIRGTYWLIRKQEGMGLGDAKLMAMLAAWLGLPGAVLSFVLAVCMGAAFAFGLLAQPKARRGAKSWATTPLPFGTFLCIAGIVSSIWGQQIVSAYLRWSGLN